MSYQIIMQMGGATFLLPVNVGAEDDETDRCQTALAYFQSRGFTPVNVPVGNEAPPLGNPQERIAAPPQYVGPTQQGLTPPAAPAPSYQPQQQGWAQPQTGSWACPIHGTASIKPGYEGQGFECGVRAVGGAPAWRYRDGAKRDQPQMGYTFWGKDQRPVFVCAERSR